MENKGKESKVFPTTSNLSASSMLLPMDMETVECDDFIIPGRKNLGYRITDNTKNPPKEESYNLTNVIFKPEPSESSCEYFLIKEETKKNTSTFPYIAPKIIADHNDATTAKKRFLLEPYKKRDEKKRATHNEIERRRRDKINSWFFKLKELIPDSKGPNATNDTKAKPNANDSKSDILISACEYIIEMQDELKSLRECLRENDNLREQNQQLQLEIDELKGNVKLENRVDAISNLQSTESDNSL